MSSPLGGAMPPPVYDAYTLQVGANLTESIHTLLTEREGSMFDNALAAYYRRRSVKLFVEALHIVLNTNAKRQLLIPIRDAYIKASDVPRFNELVVSLGLAASTLNRKKKAKSKDGIRGGSPVRPGAVMVDVKKDSGEIGFSISGGSESGAGVVVSWVAPGSSADKNGLQVGDQILIANDKSFESISHYEAVEIINRSKKLRLWVLPNAKVPSSRTANMAFTWVDPEGKQTSPPVPEEQHSERTIRFTVTKGKDLGISIRGGSQHGLGIYISVVEEGSVAWEEGLKKGDQIIDVNGHSFRSIRHSDAVRVLRSNPTMIMKLRDVGKLPYTKILPYNDKKWHNSQGATFPRTAQRQASESPILLKKHEGRRSPVREVMESLAMTVFTHPELTSFKKLVYLYEHQEMAVEEFAKELLKLLDCPEKLRLLSEVKTIIMPDDLNTFNELTVRKELEAKKAMKANGTGTYAEAVSHTLPKQSSKTHKYQLHIGDDDDDDDDDDTTGPLNGYVSEDLDEPETRSSSRALRAAGSLDDIPQRLSPSGIPSFFKPPPPPTSTSTPGDSDIDMPLISTLKERRKRIQHEDSENFNQDNPMSTQWSESSLQSGVSKDTHHDPSVPSLKGIRQWTENGEAPLAADFEARVRNEMELKLRKEFEEKERIKGEELKKQLLEEQRRREEAIKAEKEALQKKIKEIEQNAKQEAEAKLRQQLEEQERELFTRVQQEQQEKLQTERKAAEQRVKEAEERAKRELEQKALKEAEERMKAEYETRLAQEAAKLKETVAKSGDVEKKIRQELEAKMQREYEQKLQEELRKRTSKEEEERKSKEQAVLVNKDDEVARLEAEEEARMAMEERIRREAEAKVRAEYEARLQRETQEKVRLAEEIKVHKAAEARLQKEQETGDQKRNAGLDLLKKPISEKKPKAEEVLVEPLRKQVQVTGENERPSVLKKPTEKKPKVEDVVMEVLRKKTSDENDELEMQVKTAEEDLKQRQEADAAQQKKEEEKRKKEELQRKREENLRKREQEKKTGGAQQEGKKTQLPQARGATGGVADEALMENLRDQEKAQREREEQERAEREKADQELARRQKADKERAEQREKAERERAEREKAEREKAEQEKAERARAEQEKAERARAEQEKAERARAEQEKAERARAEQEKAERARAEQEKAERERAEKEKEKAEREKVEQEKAEREKAEQALSERERELKLQKERDDAERKRIEAQKQEESNVAEQKRLAAEEKKKAENARKVAFNVKHEPVNFGSDAPAIKTKQQLIEEERQTAEEKLKKKLQEKIKQQSFEGIVGTVQLREKTKPAPKPEPALPKQEAAAPKAAEPIPKPEEPIPKAEPSDETVDSGPSTEGFSYAGYDNLHGRLDTIKVIKFTKKLGIAIDGGANTKQKAVLIREIMPDGCAASTNLRVGQQILEVNGSSVYGLKHRDVVMNIKDAFEGPLNKTIEFVILEREPTS